ncbi:dTMP kinase [[Mycoplasma] mobile]|uniref:Thymidylate kinase n=1 Tax=Mycoplasma mobile (strain ATCC 43663 / 163K / NCTC 11711) TaxID=267748 RepID=KTHY_MYCM1|nr:dTMP kinase [[Mycoplasma] mobile]Q6KIL4.1 RecName: Full=Thymidylate kinase; AltName: Full=dTMP kinase [Mycoplasma mobile 163K]AAT27562.1 thymidylate kinase [Mycoplasma mobile 163K]
MFISFEGIDGAGKSTIIKKLKRKLPKLYPDKKFVFTREPGGKKLKEAEKIRKILLDKKTNIDPMTETLLYAASRRVHLDSLIWPALKKGHIVISDRYVDSSYVYQGIARGLGVKVVKEINDIATSNFMPDYTFFLSISEEESIIRRHKRGKPDRLEMSSKDFFSRAYEGYFKIINSPTMADRFILVNAEENVGTILKNILNEFDKILKK